MKLVVILLSFGTLSFGQTSNDKKEGEKIEGYFLGKGRKITATSVRKKEGSGNPIENGTPAEYEIQFSDSKLKPIKAGCCEIILVNEGDLNNNGTDEISFYQAPMNGRTFTMSTYSYNNGNWKQIVKPFLIPTGCNQLNNDELQSRIFLQNKKIYYYETVSDNDSGKLSLKKMPVQ